MRAFEGRHYRVIGTLIRSGDIDDAGVTLIVSAAIVRLAPFIEACSAAICQGNAHFIILLLIERKIHMGTIFVFCR
ncbi:MAG TPA: hypothetical protein VGI28_08815 [Stellaceae bacterium]|jgi:hypothetical protein